jgi:hypothetical protein
VLLFVGSETGASFGLAASLSRIDLVRVSSPNWRGLLPVVFLAVGWEPGSESPFDAIERSDREGCEETGLCIDELEGEMSATNKSVIHLNEIMRMLSICNCPMGNGEMLSNFRVGG